MRSILIIATLFMIQGCSVWDQFKDSAGLFPDSSEIELVITTDEILNVREGGQSSPVILRIHELSSPILYRSLDFFALFENDKSSLGDEYIKRYEYKLQPDQSLTELITLDPATRALGFSVAFRDINGSAWRKVQIIEERTSYFLKLNIEGSELHSDATRGIEQVYF